MKANEIKTTSMWQVKFEGDNISITKRNLVDIINDYVASGNANKECWGGSRLGLYVEGKKLIAWVGTLPKEPHVEEFDTEEEAHDRWLELMHTEMCESDWEEGSFLCWSREDAVRMVNELIEAEDML